MAYQYDYTTLAADLVSWPSDDDSAYALAIPNIIAQGELDVLREFNLATFDTTKTANITASSATITKPTGCIAALSLSYGTGASYRQLTRMSPDFVRRYNAEAASSAELKYYCEEDETTYRVAPIPNFSTTNGMSIRCISRPTMLDSGAPTTKSWVSTNYPDLLLLACLMAAHVYLKNDRRWGMAKTEWDLKLPAAKAEVAELRRTTPADQLMRREIIRPGNNDAQPENQ